MNLISTSSASNGWKRLPFSLRLIIKARLWTAIGAGGVLYLTPLVFNSLGFSAEQIGSGITIAAFAGITTRLGTGYILDKKYSYGKAIQIACLIAIISDLILFNSHNYTFYLCGQFCLGAAAGIYWPSVELAVPINCQKGIKSSEGFALARSSDAIGVTLGVSIGTIGTYFEFARIVYFIDIICMIYVYIILKNGLNTYKINKRINLERNTKGHAKKSIRKSKIKWIISLLPLLLVALFVTAIMSLLQAILPLDLVNGGIIRPSLTEVRVAKLMTIKLVLIAIFQWPVGYILRNKNSSFKFRLCLISLLIGFIFLSISNLLLNGYLLVLIAFIPITISLCIFLPSASDAIIKSSHIEYRGSAIALYSQCFGISALIVPWMTGKLIDTFNTAFYIWLIVSIICILLMPFCQRIK